VLGVTGFQKRDVNEICHTITWQDLINKDMEKGGLTWDEAMSVTTNRSKWRNWIAQCASHRKD